MILSTYLVECIVQGLHSFLCLLFTEAVLNTRRRQYHHNLFYVFCFCFFSACLTAQVTYTFMHPLPDDDESVSQ